MKQLTLLLLLGLSFVATQAEVYRWVDSEGNIHLTETPPPPETQQEGTVVEEFAMPTLDEDTQTDEAETAEETDDTQEGEVADGAENGTENTENTEAAQASAEQNLAIKRRNCETAQGRMEALTSQTAILKKDEKGENVLMNDEMRQAAIAETQEYINKYCGNSETQ
jgi:hypothetical protein